VYLSKSTQIRAILYSETTGGAAYNPVPMEVSGFKIKRTIGQGGMGTVYLATQESLDRDVCLKTMNASRADSAEYFERFLNEGRIVAGLRHPHIITIFDIGASGDVVYIAMEYVEGGDLKGRLFEPMSPSEALDIIIRVGSALDLAHHEGIIHRDVKPANILFRSNGDPLLTDFGIAKQLKIDAELTSTGTILGSPFYMSPEQSEGTEIDGRTDIYSLGVILYEMLTGERPYVGDSPIKIIMQHLQAPLPTMRPEFARFQPLIDRMLCKDRTGRFSDAGAMVDYALDAYEREARAGADAAAPSAPASRKAKMTSPFNRRSVALGLGGLLSLVIGFTGIYLYAESLKNTNIVVQRSPSGPRPGGGGLATLTGLNQPASALEVPRANIKREDVLKALRWLGQHSLQQDRLTSPPADNAYYYFSRLLALDGRNSDAREGFEQIAEQYIALAERQYTAKNDLQAQVYIALGLQVDPSNEGLLALQSILKDRKRSLWDALLGLFSRN
jgi:serine/threonine protein kinase